MIDDIDNFIGWGDANIDNLKSKSKPKKSLARGSAKDNNEIRFEKYVNKIYKLIKNFDALVAKMPKEGEQYRIITTKSFNSISIIAKMIQRFGVIDEIYIAMYSMNSNSVNFLMNLLDEKYILKANFIVSSFFGRTKKTEKWCKILIDYAKNKKNVNVYLEWSHAKIMIFKIGKTGHYVLEGSGNLSDNARIEQYLFEQSKSSYEFHKKWMTKVAQNQQ